MRGQETNPNVRRSRRTKADFVDAALRILDDQGLPDLTMRHLAEVLGVQPSALYWHFENKQSLLAAVSKRILAPLEDVNTISGSLSESASTLGAGLRDCLLAHRDGAELVSSSLALGLIDPPLHAKLVASAQTLNESELLAETASEAITHFVIGYAFHEQQGLQASVLGASTLLTPDAAVSADASTVPTFEAVIKLIAAGITAHGHDEAKLAR